MPKHTGFLTYLLGFFPALRENAQNLGQSFFFHTPLDYRSLEPVLTGFLIIFILLVLGARARKQYLQLDSSVVPDDTLTVRTFFEAFFGYFYDMAKEVMGPKKAKKYFPLIGGAAGFIFFSNAVALIPGFNPPTSSLNITVGTAIVVFIAFNYFGLKETGINYIKHLAGPKWFLAPLIFPVEVISTCVRPVTLAIRLMLNIAVDHLMASIFLGLVALFVPVPLALLGIIVVCVQTLVFCLLSCIYIGLATESGDHH